MRRISMLLPGAATVAALLTVSGFCTAATASAAVNLPASHSVATQGVVLPGGPVPCPQGAVCLYGPNGTSEVEFLSHGCYGLYNIFGARTLVNDSGAIVRLYANGGCAGTPVKEIPSGSEAEINFTSVSSIEIG